MRDYYDDPHVQQRMFDFLGSEVRGGPSCLFLQRCDLEISMDKRRSPGDMPSFLSGRYEIGRSLADRHALIAHLDVEYVNADFPGEALVHPERSFELQLPVMRAIEEELADHDIAPLHLLSPRGHHFVWKIDKCSGAFRELADVGRLPPHLRPGSPRAERVGPEDRSSSEEGDESTLVSGVDELAHAGLGMLLEHLAHRVIDRVEAGATLPVTLTEVVVGCGERGRESISIDLSAYGDPLHTRVIRVPFSIYLKPWAKPGMVAEDGRRPLLVLVPLHEIDTRRALEVRGDLAAAAELAHRACTRIPEMGKGTKGLLQRYRESTLARFHAWFYSIEHVPHERWHETYDRLDPATLPPCVAERLRKPNDGLLKPAGIQALLRTLWGHYWHPRDVAGLLRSLYERDHGWGDRFLRYDAALRADFYVRLFSGLIATGRDELVDFNCVSEREKGLCDQEECSCQMHELRGRALARSWA